MLLRGGRVLDPCRRLDASLDLLMENGIIMELSPRISVRRGVVVLDCQGKVIVPGLIDVHVHLRDFDESHKETIATGTRAAALGGFTTLVCEPNTLPPMDSKGQLQRWIAKVRREALVNLYTQVCITKGRRGERLVRFGALAQSPHVVAATDDGNPVVDDRVMERAFRASRRTGLLLAPHCEDAPGLPPRGESPFWSEPLYVRREVELAERFSTPVHISHLSTAEAAEIVRGTKARGVKVSCEATPHHLLLDRSAEKKIGPDAKVNPPLRTRDDLQALKEALREGVIDIIASDHAPHSPQEKARGWDKAPFGVIGLETTLGVVLTHLVGEGWLSLEEAVERMSCRPAEVFGLPGGVIEEGREADLTVIDLGEEWVVDPGQFASKGRNTPFKGWRLRGRAWGTIVRGGVVMWARVLQPPLPSPS